MSRAPRFNAAALPPEIADRLSAKDRKALNVETSAEHAARMEAESERELQRECENYLRQREIEFLHLSTRSREKAGWPDLVFSLNGYFVAVELKDRNGKLSEDQTRCLARLKSNGAQAHICRSFAQFRAVVLGGGKVIPTETLFDDNQNERTNDGLEDRIQRPARGV